MESIVPELRRPERRELIRLGRKSGDPDTANRFAAVAKLAAPDRPSKSCVARELELAISTVVSAARRFVLGGAELLYDQRVHNGRTRKVDERFELYVSAALYETPPDRGWERVQPASRPNAHSASTSRRTWKRGIRIRLRSSGPSQRGR